MSTPRPPSPLRRRPLVVLHPRRMCAPRARLEQGRRALGRRLLDGQPPQRDRPVVLAGHVSAGIPARWSTGSASGGRAAAAAERPRAASASPSAPGCGATTTGCTTLRQCVTRFHQPRLCAVTLRWPRHHELSVSVPFCEPGSSSADGDELPRVHVPACAPFFLNPNAARERRGACSAGPNLWRRARWPRTSTCSTVPPSCVPRCSATAAPRSPLRRVARPLLGLL